MPRLCTAQMPGRGSSAGGQWEEESQRACKTCVLLETNGEEGEAGGGVPPGSSPRSPRGEGRASPSASRCAGSPGPVHRPRCRRQVRGGKRARSRGKAADHPRAPRKGSRRAGSAGGPQAFPRPAARRSPAPPSQVGAHCSAPGCTCWDRVRASGRPTGLCAAAPQAPPAVPLRIRGCRETDSVVVVVVVVGS